MKISRGYEFCPHAPRLMKGGHNQPIWTAYPENDVVQALSRLPLPYSAFCHFSSTFLVV